MGRVSSVGPFVWLVNAVRAREKETERVRFEVTVLERPRIVAIFLGELLDRL